MQNPMDDYPRFDDKLIGKWGLGEEGDGFENLKPWYAPAWNKNLRDETKADSNLEQENPCTIQPFRICVVDFSNEKKVGVRELKLSEGRMLSDAITLYGGLSRLTEQRYLMVVKDALSDKKGEIIFSNWERHYIYHDWEQDVQMDPGDILIFSNKYELFRGKHEREWDALESIVKGLSDLHETSEIEAYLLGNTEGKVSEMK